MVPGVTQRGPTLTRVDREERSLVQGMIQVTLLHSCSVPNSCRAPVLQRVGCFDGDSGTHMSVRQGVSQYGKNPTHLNSFTLPACWDVPVTTP